MKNSETDKDFLDLIKNTLDNYEEQYILGSWENYVKTRKKRRKIILLRIGSGIAASLLIGWLGFRLIPSVTFSHSSDKEHQSYTYNNPGQPPVDDTLSGSTQISRVPAGNTKSGVPDGNDNHFKSHNRSGSLQKKGTNESRNPEIVNLKTSLADNTKSVPDTFKSSTEETLKLSDTLQAGMSIAPDGIDNGKALPETEKTDSSDYKLLYKQTDPLISNESDITTRSADHKFRFGVNLSPGVTSTNTASSFNYSGGINADFHLFSAFRFSTGLQFEHLSVVNSDPSYDPSLPSGETKAELVDLDIPLNITWKFLVRKSTSYYVSSGISSVVYLSENYASTSYSQEMVKVVEVMDGKPNLTYQMENVRNTEQTTEDPLNTFDFASRVNIIFGYEQHLSSKLFLHIEPYLKIPISDQAARNIKYTTGGITCKISF
jgi:hypothetical protein